MALHYQRGLPRQAIPEASDMAQEKPVRAAKRGVERSPHATPTRYAKSGALNIAYQVVGDEPINLVFVPG